MYILSYQKLFDIIEAKKMTARSFSMACGISINTINKIKNDGKIPSVPTINKICEYLSCSPDDIMEWVSTEDIKAIERAKKQREIQELRQRLAELENN